MSVKETNKVDAIGVAIKTGNLVLSIIDEENWEDEKTHLKLLEDKLNGYINFIESGEIYNAYQDAEGRTFMIKLFARYPLPPKAVKFLEKVSDIVEERGYVFKYKVLTNDLN